MSGIQTARVVIAAALTTAAAAQTQNPTLGEGSLPRIGQREPGAERPAWQSGPVDGPAELPMERALSISEGIKSLLESHDILIIGENHLTIENIYPQIVRAAAASGVDTLYIEFGRDLQPILDRYAETGSDEELFKALPALSLLTDLADLLQAARDENLRIVAIDLPAEQARVADNTTRGPNMAATINEEPFDNKALVVVGAYHAENRQTGVRSLRTLLGANHRSASVQLLSQPSIDLLKDELTARGRPVEAATDQMRAWMYYFEDNAPADSFFIDSTAVRGLDFYSPLAGGWNTYQVGFTGLIFLSDKDASRLTDLAPPPKPTLEGSLPQMPPVEPKEARNLKASELVDVNDGRTSPETEVTAQTILQGFKKLDGGVFELTLPKELEKLAQEMGTTAIQLAGEILNAAAKEKGMEYPVFSEGNAEFWAKNEANPYFQTEPGRTYQFKIPTDSVFKTRKAQVQGHGEGAPLGAIVIAEVCERLNTENNGTLFKDADGDKVWVRGSAPGVALSSHARRGVRVLDPYADDRFYLVAFAPSVPARN